MIFLGIGSNLPSKFGNRFKNIILATSHLKQSNIEIVKQSSFYETFAYPNKSDPKFINIVISVKTKLTISELMSLLIKIEKKLERKRSKKNEPRTCDIDIIDYNGEVFSSEELKIIVPHKSMSSRNFVLYPLKEICPSWMHPLTKKNIDNLIKDLNTSNNEITKLNQNDINNHVK
tara:strand:- start:53 stop:577 length:525 start_codon:yes stop_codon:yes gene_type:complete